MVHTRRRQNERRRSFLRHNPSRIRSVGKFTPKTNLPNPTRRHNIRHTNKLNPHGFVYKQGIIKQESNFAGTTFTYGKGTCNNVVQVKLFTFWGHRHSQHQIKYYNCHYGPFILFLYVYCKILVFVNNC